MTFWNGSRWVEEPNAGSLPGVRARDKIATLVMALGLVALAVPLAGVAARSSAGTITLNQPNPVHYMSSNGSGATANGTANVNFTVTQSATDEPWVTVVCTGKQSYSARSLILYGQTLGYFASWPYGQTFTVGVGSSNKWVEPTKASCTAQLWWADSAGTAHNLASTSFVAEP